MKNMREGCINVYTTFYNNQISTDNEFKKLKKWQNKLKLKINKNLLNIHTYSAYFHLFKNTNKKKHQNSYYKHN